VQIDSNVFVPPIVVVTPHRYHLTTRDLQLIRHALATQETSTTENVLSAIAEVHDATHICLQ